MSKNTVLVVEDDQLLREVIEDLLYIHHIEVKTVGNSTEADDWLEEQVPDLIICDLFLPKVSGIQWLNTVSERLVANESSIILLSADHERTPEMLEDSPIHSLVKYQLKKPFKNDELIRLIHLLQPNS
jgi:DNA-binding response OmpR family regulator